MGCECRRGSVRSWLGRGKRSPRKRRATEAGADQRNPEGEAEHARVGLEEMAYEGDYGGDAGDAGDEKIEGDFPGPGGGFQDWEVVIVCGAGDCGVRAYARAGDDFACRAGFLADRVPARFGGFGAARRRGRIVSC